jgi:hypothetical protein
MRRRRSGIVGGRGDTVKAALAIVLVVGCGWRSYGRTMATHVEVLVAIAAKGVDLVAGGRLTAESMPELTYPLERAQAFARTATSQSASPPSLAAFQTLCARYRDLIDTLDRIRRDQRGDAARATLAGPLAAVQAAAAAVTDALAREGW